MAQEACISNLIVNGSFEEGAGPPTCWQWTVVSGGPIWTFDGEVRFAGRRSVKILQDIGNQHGQFRQRVKCSGAKRYRLRARIRVALEGTGDDSGANLSLRAFNEGRLTGELRYRPFLVGRADWSLWEADYVTPRDADTLEVAFDMRRSAGVAWFDCVELFEVSEPLDRSLRPPHGLLECLAAPKRVHSICVIAAQMPEFLIREVLTPLLGAENVTFRTPRADIRKIGQDAVILFDAAASANHTFRLIAGLADERLVIMTGEALAAVAGGISQRVVEDGVVAPCVRIEKDTFLTKGLRRTDTAPWWSDAADSGLYSQRHLRASGHTLERLGFSVAATSVCAQAAASGHPAILYRPSSRRGLVVMDLEPLNSRPSYSADANIACLVLTNALGRPQTMLGTYVVPAFDYDRFAGDLHSLARRSPAITLREEGSSREGRSIYSLSVGRSDAPVFFADAGIHPYEWAPCFGLVLFAARLADELERGHPVAKALLESMRFTCVPIFAPDGWGANARNSSGVNLNRNFPLYWDDYNGEDKGSTPLSEPETRTIARILEEEPVIAAMSWHETSANTNWVGMPRFDGPYARHKMAVPAVFRQFIDPAYFYWQASQWTQVTDPRNFQYHYTDSYPYLRSYRRGRHPLQIHYSDSLGIRSFLVEQYGNSEMYHSASPQRTDITCRILEMLFGLELGLVCRNGLTRVVEAAVPLHGAAQGSSVVYSAAGDTVERRPLVRKGTCAIAQASIPPGGSMVVRLGGIGSQRRRGKPAG